MPKGKLEDFDTAEGFRRFILARGSATAEDVASQLELSRASYYRLVDMFVERLYGSQEPPQDKGMKPAVPWFHQPLLDAVEQHPDWGCYRLAEALSDIRKVSGPTVQRELARLHLETRNQRFAHKEMIVIKKPGNFALLSEEERRLLISNNPCLTDLALVEQHPDTIQFAAQVLNLSGPGGNAARFLLLLVCLNTCVVFLENLNADTLSDALWTARQRATAIIAELPRQQYLYVQVRIVMDTSKHLFLSLHRTQSNYPTEIAISKRETPATLKMMARRVKKEVADRYLELVATEGIAVALELLDSWTNEHNHLARLGFPTFGVSPNELMYA